MPNDFYKSDRLSGFSKAKAMTSAQTVTSPITGEPLSYTLEYLPGGPQLFTTLYKSVYNQRSAAAEHLTRADVNDIFDDIKATKGNTFEVLGVRDGDKIELLAGLRRTFCCSLLADSQLQIKIFANLNDAEKRHYAIASDQYTQPNAVNRGFALIALEASLKAQGKDASTKELAKIYGISTGSVSEYKSYAQALPKGLYALFPGLSFIEVRFLRRMLSYKERPELAELLATFTPVVIAHNEVIDDKKLITSCQALQKQILSGLKDTVTPIESEWRSLAVKPGFRVKVNDKGKINIEFKEAEIDKLTRSQLLALIKKA